MAITTNPAWKAFKGTRGSISKTIVFKQYGDKTVVTKYPDMTGIEKTPAQINVRNKFTEAVQFAREIIRDPVKKASYPVQDGRSVYHTAIKDFMAHSEGRDSLFLRSSFDEKRKIDEGMTKDNTYQTE